MTKRKNKPLDMNVGKHHWSEGLKPNLKYLGFVYMITNKTTNKKYIGRKQMWMTSKGKRIRQAKWNYYTGSSKSLNKDIDQLGIDNFEFKILRHYLTKSGLRYGEIEEIITRKCLVSYDQDENASWYNGTVDKAYRPKEYYKGRKRIER